MWEGDTSRHHIYGLTLGALGNMNGYDGGELAVSELAVRRTTVSKLTGSNMMIGPWRPTVRIGSRSGSGVCSFFLSKDSSRQVQMAKGHLNLSTVLV